MRKITSFIFKNQDGVTAIEYGLIAALIVVVIIGTLSATAGSTVNMWNYVKTSMDSSVQNAR